MWRQIGRLETAGTHHNLPKSISASLPEERNAQNRFVYIKAVSPTTPELCLETRPFQSGDRCPTADLGQSIPLCISPILPYSTSPEESELRPNRKTVACHTNLAVPNLVPPSTRNVYSSSTATSKEHKLNKPTRGSSPSNCKQDIMTSGVDHIRERLLKKGVSETAAQLITSTRRKSSQSNYNSSWRMWASWCDKQQIDEFRCDVIKILDYLAFLFEKDYEYRTIRCHRSAISAFHDWKPVGQHPEICAVVSGIFNNRPPQPRYMFVWSVESVINFIKNKWKNNENLSEKYLTYKLVILMVLTFASRASAMHCLDVRFMVKSEDAYIFTFHKLHKSWRKGKAPPKLYLFRYPKDQELCVVSALNEYLKCTEKWRTNGDKFQLLLSYIKPHVEVHSSIASRWIKEILNETGVDVDVFKGHPTRLASVSKACLSGISVDDILSQGSWSNESTWQKFYHKQALLKEQVFQERVLD